LPVSRFASAAYEWDCEKIFFLAGGATPLQRLIAAENVTPPALGTMYMWRTRGRIAAAWVPTVVYVLLKAGARFDEILRIRPAPLPRGKNPALSSSSDATGGERKRKLQKPTYRVA